MSLCFQPVTGLPPRNQNVSCSKIVLTICEILEIHVKYIKYIQMDDAVL